MNQIFVNAKKVLVLLAEMSDDMRSRIIHEVANSIITHQTDLLDANSDDLSRMDPESPIYDRLKLTTKRLKDIADSMHTVADMPSPVRRVVQHKVLPNGLDLLRQSVPYGVIGVIYEARPNVTFDVFSLCYKSGNACILKGGKDAQATNEAAVALIQEVLHRYSPTAYACQLMPATHEATAELLQARGYVDLCIPRGGKKLIEFVRDNAKVPCIETGAGVVHTFFDKSGDTDMGAAIINNAKTRRPAVCNSLDTLLIHELRLNRYASTPMRLPSRRSVETIPPNCSTKPMIRRGTRSGWTMRWASAPSTAWAKRYSISPTTDQVTASVSSPTTPPVRFNSNGS